MRKLTDFAKRAAAFARDVLLRRRNAILAHHAGLWFPAVPSVIVPDLQVSEQDVTLAERLLAAYRKAAQRDLEDGGVWSIIRSRQSKFISILENRSAHALAVYLGGMNRHDATIGTVQGVGEYERITRSRRYRNFIALQAKDKLVSLAEAVGALPCENPEQGPWGDSLHLKTDDLAAKIEEKLGFDIAPPGNDGGLLKIVSTRGLFSERDANALYTAWLLKEIFAPKQIGPIGEIGAGAGRVAYWSSRFGCESYTIFDLPHINVLQGYYLQKVLPAGAVALFGEAAASINVLPYFEFFNVAPKRFDVILNQDSFPEIEAGTVIGYLERIKINSSRYFLSINHESRPRAHLGQRQINVPELVSQVGGYRRLSRQLYWLRKGYVAELYDVGRDDKHAG